MRDPRCVGQDRMIRGRGRCLLSADADTAAAATTTATLRQAFGRASTVVDGQPLGLPGQKVAGHPPVPDGWQIRRHLVVNWIINCSWNAIPLYFPIKVENRGIAFYLCFIDIRCLKSLRNETNAEEVLSRMCILFFYEGEINSLLRAPLLIFKVRWVRSFRRNLRGLTTSSFSSVLFFKYLKFYVGNYTILAN